jgi:hypothetical protein
MASQKVHLSRSERECASPPSLRRTLQVRLTPRILRALPCTSTVQGLAPGAFYFAIPNSTFYEIVKTGCC